MPRGDLAGRRKEVPDSVGGLFSVSGQRVGSLGRKVAAPAARHAWVHLRLVDVDIRQRAAQQLQGAARQRLGVLGRQGELVGDAGRALCQPVGDDGRRALGRGQRGQCRLEPLEQLGLRRALGGGGMAQRLRGHRAAARLVAHPAKARAPGSFG